MTFEPVRLPDDTDSLPQLPGWVTSVAAETPGIVAFQSGAALLVPDQLLGDPGKRGAGAAAGEPARAERGHGNLAD